jgi:hypothetical protein
VSRFLACLIVALAAGPVAACLNDVELPSHEREFRSQYRDPTAPPPSASPEPAGRPGTRLLIGAGVVLLTTASVFTLAGRRARS